LEGEDGEKRDWSSRYSREGKKGENSWDRELERGGGDKINLCT